MPRPEWSFLMLPEDHKEVKWSLSFLQAHFTPWGQIAFGMIMVGLAISSVGTQVSAYLFVSFVWALFLSALVLSWFFKPQVIALRELPATPTAGGMCLYRVRLKNVGKKPIRNLEIFDHKLPYGLYAADHPKQKTATDWLEPGQTVFLSVALRIPQRGSYTLLPLLVGSSFPTGLIRSTRRASNHDAFDVFPKQIRYQGHPLHLKPQFQSGGNSLSSSFGQSNEFLSTREYRASDRPRDIHWNSSARTGKLIVKEYVDEYFIRVGLFVDTELRRFEKHRCFEKRISLCAGMAEEFYEKNYIVDLFLSDEHTPVVQVARGRDHIRHLLEMLSAIEGDAHVHFSHALAKIKAQANQLSGLIVYLKDWDQHRETFVKSIKDMNVAVVVIIIRDQPLSLDVKDEGVMVYTSQDMDAWL